MRAVRFSLVLALSAAVAVPQLHAKPAKSTGHPAAEAQTLDLAKRLIALRSVRGPGNKTAEALEVERGALIAGGWDAGDIEIVPVDDTAYMIATWPGSDPSLKPLVISGHLDVVEANPADWQRDPFTPVVENGLLYGRGASDMKYSAALATAALIELRRSGFKPRRSIVLEFSGDEETTMKTSRIIAERLKRAEMVLNIDGGGGTFDETTGKPLSWVWGGAEKTYVDYRLEVTNPGGHSSWPRDDNAIVQLATALTRIGAYRFTPEQNPITKGYFEAMAAFEPKPEVAAAMRAFATNPADVEAVKVLRGTPYVGKTGTTCVATMISGGHAENALPQRATANINCRVFPGHSREEIRAELERVAAMPQVAVTDVSGGDTTEAPASPMRPDLIAALGAAMKASWPGVPIVPNQDSGASDSVWFRALGVPSYGIGPTFGKDSDEFSHGLNERIALSNTAPGITYYLSLFTDLSK